MGKSSNSILIAGFYGFGNTGDEAILTAMVTDLRAADPSLELTVISADPETTRRIFGVNAVSWAHLHDVLAAVGDADLVILGGGGLFHDYWGVPLKDILLPEHIQRSMQNGYAGVAVYARLMEKPLMLYAVGVGPLLTSEGQRVTRIVARVAQLITTRDRASAELLLQLGISEGKIHVTADPAFALSPNHIWATKYWQQVKLDDGPRLVVNVRPWEFAGPTERWIGEIASGLELFHRKFGGTTLFVPFHAQDLEMAHQLQSSLCDASSLQVLPNIPTPAAVAGIIAQADLVLGMRYHSVVFAIQGHVPLLALTYDPKVHHVMQDVQLSEFAIPLKEARGDVIAQKLQVLWTRRAAVREVLASEANSLKLLAQRNTELALGLLQEPVRSPAEIDKDLLRMLTKQLAWELAQRTAEFRAAQRRLQGDYARVLQEKAHLESREYELTAQLHTLRTELDAIKQSRSWTIIEALWRWRMRWFPPQSKRSVYARRALATAQNAYWTVRTVPHKTRAQALSFLRRHLPQRVKQALHEFVDERTFPNRHKVILFADEHVLPEYRPREEMGQIREETRVPVSLITTVLNEEDNVVEWMRSLSNQRLHPDEVIVVDGGSSDKTLALLQETAREVPFPVRIIEAPGTTIAQGRNIAISEAQHEIVACTDLGCILDSNWLHDLIYPFTVRPEVDVSCGFYQALVSSERERLLARFFVPQLEHVTPQSFLPSGRSVAMKKRVWARAGGYPEWLTDAGEDTLFDILLQSQPSWWAFVPSAIVYWHTPRTLRQLWRTVYRYARGDGETGLLSSLYVNKMKKLFRYMGFLTVSLLVAIGASVLGGLTGLGILAFVLALFLFWGLWKDHQKGGGEFASGLYRFVATQVFLLAQLVGFVSGVRNRPLVRERQRQLFRDRLQSILERHTSRKGTVVYPPTHDWGFMFQRPQQMMRAFARAGYLVFYMTNNERVDAVVGFQEVEPGLYLTHVPMEVLTTIDDPILYIGSPWHSRVPEQFHRPTVIYDHYDDLEVSSARYEDHERLLSSAHVVVTNSERLAQRVRERRPDAILAPNGVDYGFIASMRPDPSAPPPSDLKGILAQGRPIVGYSGALAQWFDYDLLDEVARMRPELSFVLVGVDYDGTLHRSGVLELPNVYWLGLKPYEELFKYVWRFDVATIPFKINDVTLATSPIKLFEYMACEKPVVTTPLPECEKIEEVLVAKDAAAFSRRIDEALELSLDQDFRARLRQRARMHTWDERVRHILTALEEHV